MTPSTYVPIVNALCDQYGIPRPASEVRFAPPRRFRIDFGFVKRGKNGYKIGLEVEGGIWIRGGGRHNRGKGMLSDMTKYNLAAALGWRIVRCTPQTLISGIEAVKACLPPETP